MRWDEMDTCDVHVDQSDFSNIVCMHMCVRVFFALFRCNQSRFFFSYSFEQSANLMFYVMKEHDQRERKLDSCTIKMINWKMSIYNNNKLTANRSIDIDKIMW